MLLVVAALPARGRNLSSYDVDALLESKPTLVEPFGPDPMQFGQLRLPEGNGLFPVAVVMHGGCWTKG